MLKTDNDFRLLLTVCDQKASFQNVKTFIQ